MATVRIGLEVDPKTGKATILDMAGALDKFDTAAGKSKKNAKELGTAFDGAGAEAKKLAKSAGDDLAAKLGPAGRVIAAMGPAGLVAAAGLGGLTIAVGAASAAVFASVRAVTDAAERYQTLSKALGLSMETFSAFDGIARLSNTSVEAFGAAARVMQQNIAQGDPAIKALGVSLEALKRQSPEQQFSTLAEKIRELPPGYQRTTAALAVFGKQAMEIMPAIEDGIAKTDERARELGFTLSKEALDAAADLKSQADELSLAWEGVVRQFGAAVASSPELLALLEDLTEAAADVAQSIAENAAEITGFFDDIALGARMALTSVKLLAQFASDLKHEGPLKAGEALMATLDKHAQIAAANKRLRDLGMDIKVGEEGVQFGTGPRRPGAGSFDPDAGKRADKEKEAWLKAAEEARKAWDKFYLGFEIGTKNAASQVQREFSKQGQASSDIFAKALGREMDAREEERLSTLSSATEVGEDVLETLLEIQDESDAAFTALSDGIQRAAGGFDFLGDAIGGAMGEVLKFVGGTIAGLGSIMDNIKNFKTAGGGIGGFLGKVGAGLGVAGVALGIGKAIFGFFGKDKEEERKREEERAAATKKATADLQALQERMERFRMDKIQGEVTGVTAMFKGLATSADVSQERIDRLGRLGFAALQQLKAEGLSSAEAMKQFAPALDAALEAAARAGLELPPALAQLAAFRQKLTDNPELVAATEGWNAFVEGILATGGQTQEVFADLLGEQKALFNEMLEKGFTVPEALAEQARGLFALQQAADAGRISVDAETQALIDQAEALGLFDNLKDPMAELVEIQKLQLAVTVEMARVFGAVLPAAVQAYIDKLNQIPQVAGPPGTGEAGIPSPQDNARFPGEDGIPGFALGGFVPHTPPMGRLIRAGERGGEWVVPEGQMAARSGGTSTTPNVTITYAPQVAAINVPSGDPRAVTRAVYEAFRDHDADLEAQVRRIVREERR